MISKFFLFFPYIISLKPYICNKLKKEIMEEYEESFNFGETIVEVAKEKQRTMSDEEYQEWLCQLSDEFAFLD